ncbi:hypothetical protein CUS_4927 [Ruminococcus albus 8]|uniref:Uncharacterized protein n=1 Tax=Ruminococcus albus 8 TaxID=246199 RepID=E9S7K2_RUMAL|nr:hypothetical protein CUS_4927 [Ruminococcus albus 8]
MATAHSQTLYRNEIITENSTSAGVLFLRFLCRHLLTNPAESGIINVVCFLIFTDRKGNVYEQ